MALVELRGLVKRFGAELAVDDLDLAVEEGEFVTLLGPSGCGKTTTLRCIAGLEHPDAGRIRIGERTVTSSEEGIFLPPEQREIGMVFQSYAVWPHMTVFDNVAYGLRVRRVRGRELERRTLRALELVGLDSLARRYATRLSGGQRQRVALARAIAYEPRVVLFDEPLSNLDAKLRESLRDELARLQREVGITSVYVTHDQTEALVMSDRVVVMNRGVIQQIGDPETLYARPVNAFVANFLGVANLLDGTLCACRDGVCDVEIAAGADRGALRLRAEGGTALAQGARVVLSVRPEDLRLHLAPPSPGEVLGGNLFEARVIDTVYLGSFLECRVRVGARELGVQLDHYEQLRAGQPVWLTFRPDHALVLAE